MIQELRGQITMFFAFTTIVQGAASGGKETVPSLHLIRTHRERASITAYLSPPDRPALNSVNLSSNIIIAVFLGLRPTSGYSIEIMSIQVSDKVLDVTVKRSAPASWEPVRQGFESPYHLVRIAHRVFARYPFSHYRLLGTTGNLSIEGSAKDIEPL